MAVKLLRIINHLLLAMGHHHLAHHWGSLVSQEKKEKKEKKAKKEQKEQKEKKEKKDKGKSQTEQHNITW